MSAGAHLLVVDDDDRIRELLREFLSRHDFRVTTAPDAASARRLMERLEFDLLIVDVMMPGEDGVGFTRWVRGQGGPPVILLTARGEAEARIEGLAGGADDYVAKPFEPQELVLRIAAVLRRTGARRPPSRRVVLGASAFDLDRAELTREGEPVRLTEGEARLLRRLAQSPHAPIDRLALARDALAGAGGGADEAGRAVDVQVTRLRRKIEPDPKNPRYLQTVRGVGYVLAPDG